MAFVKSPISLLFLLICFVSLSHNSLQAPTHATTVTETVANTTVELVNTTVTTTTAVNQEAVVPNGVGSIAKNNNYTNYALHDHKLLVNNSLNLDTSQLPRNIASSASQSANGLSITLLAVLLVVITLVVSIILTAVFVMRRRFSIWRVNGDRLTSGGRADDGAKGALTKSTSSENTSTTEETTAKVENEKVVKEATTTLTNNESQKSIECEKKMDDEEVKEVVASCIAELNSVENPAALVCVTESVKPETTVETETKTEEVKADVEVAGSVEQQPSPATSETRLIETTPVETEDKVKEQPLQTGKSASTVSLSSSAVNPVSPIPSTNDLNPPPTVEPAAVPATTNTVSSTSLITNVISDIADSVASKLTSKSTSKSALNDNNDEKQPLNNE